MERQGPTGTRASRGWPRAAGLLGVVLATSVVVPTLPWVLLGVPLAMLLAASRARGYGLLAAVALAVLLFVPGPKDGIWFAERAWAVLVGGAFIALTMAVPRWGLGSRAIASVALATTVLAVLLSLRAGAWETLDALVAGRARELADAMLDTMSLASGADAVTPPVIATFLGFAELQTAIFPAMVAIASMAALAVAWWMRTRLAGGGDQAIGPLREFRFNDHLVWLLVLGLFLVVAQWGDALARVGSNAVVFMGALYVLRGAAVLAFLTGGISLVGYVMLALVLLLAWPVIVGVTGLIGIGDTWLDLRSKGGEKPA
ncbi:MAG TPA: DUF2232 domain-containing protein [Longimicrobiales bacterium]|nr:DUF2232 domain-containing protein [Longimicrobiales bacterium]